MELDNEKAVEQEDENLSKATAATAAAAAVPATETFVAEAQDEGTPAGEVW